MPRRKLDIQWDCRTHARPVNAACEECARVVVAIRAAMPLMRASKMRRYAAELILGFAASQYGASVAGDYGRTPETEAGARQVLHESARIYAEEVE